MDKFVVTVILFFFNRENSFLLLRYANFASLLIYMKSSYDHYPYFLANILEFHSDRRIEEKKLCMIRKYSNVLRFFVSRLVTMRHLLV